MKNSDSRHRLLEMMQTLNITQTDIVKRTGIQKSSLSNYVNGKRTPTQDQLSKIADPYGINPAWLMGYDVPMNVFIDEYINSERDRSLLKKKIERKDSPVKKAMELYTMFDNSSPEIQQAVLAILKSSQQNS